VAASAWQTPDGYDAGHLRPLIDKTFPFDQTLEALAYVGQGRANGKVVITLD
jgi:NADPH:quinone reductase-like Zn-dependent oxidoreductase